VLVRHEGRTSADARWWGWLPLIAGVAMTRAVRSLGVAGAGLKWPNDVLVDTADGDRKLSGILTELTSEGVVIGAGLNLLMTQDELPVPTATSLAILGVPTDAHLTDRALAAYLRELRALVAQWRAASDLGVVRSIVEAELRTLGRAVRVDRPGLPVLVGTAEAIDDDGRLLVRSAESIEGPIAVAAGDVTHLRYE
jgi:BirA family transcriptional regulator, biotin operon repressor / biotin---[acetyl-CoA-carboxylase] ligase